MILSPLALTGALFLSTFEPQLEGPDARCLASGSSWFFDTPGRLRFGRPAFWAYDWRPSYMRVAQRSGRPEPAELITTAREFLGTPYQWGGLGEGGFDCSGFVNKVYAENGYDLPRTARYQYFIGSPVAPDKLRTGDLLFFTTNPGQSNITHVAMYVSDGEFIHAASGKGEVTYDRIASRYYEKRLVGAKRVLDLPPGRYSNSDGTARPPGGMPNMADAGSLDNIIAAAVAQDNRLHGSGAQSPLVATTSSNDNTARTGSNIGDPTVGSLLEHGSDERPAQLASSFIKGAVTHVGPRLQRPSSTAVGLRLGVGGIAGRATLVAAPEFTYFDPEEAFSVAVAAPFRLPIASGGPGFSEVNKGDWDDPREYTRLLQELRYGQKESELYLELSRTASGTLGHGSIMRYYTPNIASRSVPDYVIVPDALSLAFDGTYAGMGGETFVDDVLEPHVLGALAYARPAVLAGLDGELLRAISVGATYAVDINAPFKQQADGSFSRKPVHAASLDLEMKLWRSSMLDFKGYIDGSALMHAGGSGIGGTLGFLARANWIGRRTHVLRLRLEGKLTSAAYIASYFDTTYALSRRQASVDDVGTTPQTKLQLLESLEGTPSRWGFYGELVYQMQRRISLGVSYEDGGATESSPSAARYVSRSIQLFVELQRIYLPNGNRSVDFYFAYHLRNFDDLMPIFGLRRANEYVFASATLNAWRFVSVGGSIRKGYSPEAGKAVTDGVVNMSLHYEI